MQFEHKVGHGFFVEQDITQRVETKGNLLQTSVWQALALQLLHEKNLLVGKDYGST